jgi:hypothetical protein
MNYIREQIPLESLAEMYAQFTPVPNNQDGNCLFESVAHFHNYWEKTEESATQIRRMVSDFYDNTLNQWGKTNEDTIESFLTDLLKYETSHSLTTHQDKIRYDGIYGSVCDLIAAALLLKFNFDLYMKLSDGTFMLYQISMLNTNRKHAFYYSGCDVYNAIVPLEPNKTL